MPGFIRHPMVVRTRDFVIRFRVAFISLLVLLLGGVFINQNLAEASRIRLTLQDADPFWLTLALVMNLAVVSAAGLSYKVVLGKLGERHSWPWLANLHLKRHVVATVTPMGGAVSVYVFVKSLGSRGVSSNDALFAASIRGVVGYAAFVLILVPVLFLGNPSTVVLLGTAVLVFLLIALIAAVTTLLSQTWTPTWLMTRLPDRVTLLINQARTHQLGVRDLGYPLLLAIVHHMLGAATLHLALMAVGFRGGIETALVGYATGSLVMMLAPLFQGIGFVEVTMAVTLQQSGVPLPAAIAATLLFRFADLWFPFLLGAACQVPGLAPACIRGRRLPALAVAAVGLLVLITPLGPDSLVAVLAVPATIFPAVAIICAAWLLALAYALWHRRPISQIVVLGAVATSVPILAAQASEIFGLPMAIMHLLTIAGIA